MITQHRKYLFIYPLSWNFWQLSYLIVWLGLVRICFSSCNIQLPVRKLLLSTSYPAKKFFLFYFLVGENWPQPTLLYLVKDLSLNNLKHQFQQLLTVNVYKMASPNKLKRVKLCWVFARNKLFKNWLNKGIVFHDSNLPNHPEYPNGLDCKWWRKLMTDRLHKVTIAREWLERKTVVPHLSLYLGWGCIPYIERGCGRINRLPFFSCKTSCTSNYIFMIVK